MLLLSPPLELTGLRPGLPPEGSTFFNTDSRTECPPHLGKIISDHTACNVAILAVFRATAD